MVIEVWVIIVTIRTESPLLEEKSRVETLD